GLFSHERTKPFNIFSRKNCSRVPSFFTTISGRFSICSNVVNLVLHCSHSLLRRIAFTSSACRESTTRECVELHFGHFIELPPSQFDYLTLYYKSLRHKRLLLHNSAISFKKHFVYNKYLKIKTPFNVRYLFLL